MVYHEALMPLRLTKVKANLSCERCHRYIRDGAKVYVLDGRPFCQYCGDPDPASRITDTSRDAVVKRIKAALQKRSGKQWSVTGGRGTAYGWLQISVPKARLGCARLHEYDWQTNVCSTCGKHRNEAFLEEEPTRRRKWLMSCPEHRCTEQCYGGYIVPEDREELAALLSLDDVHTQGVQVMASHDAYVEYVDRAEGREPRSIGVPYWD